MKSLRQELLNDGNVVEERCWRSSAFLQQVPPERGSDPGPGVVRDRWLVRFNNTGLAEHDQQSMQRLRVASTNSLRPTAQSQKSIHNLAVQSLDINLFPLQPPAEIGDYDNLLSERVVCIALFGYPGRIRVEVFTQRPLAEPFHCF